MLRKTLHTLLIATALTGAAFIAYAEGSEKPQDAKAEQAPAAQANPTKDAPVGAPGAAAATADAAADKTSTDPLEPKKTIWPFSGWKGTVDKQAAQRGAQIYTQVCSACHSMDLVTYRSLSKIGFSEGEIKALASQKQVERIDDNTGERVQKPAQPFDHFVAPFANETASRAANNGAYPPDLSLIVKAREHGPDYVYSLLTGFGNPPANEPAVAGKYYDPYFAGHWISMPPPLHDNAVTYQDGTNATVDQMARDVVTFLQWATEPEMEQRHEMGIKVLIFLTIMTGFFYVAKKRVWGKLKK